MRKLLLLILLWPVLAFAQKTAIHVTGQKDEVISITWDAFTGTNGVKVPSGIKTLPMAATGETWVELDPDKGVAGHFYQVRVSVGGMSKPEHRGHVERWIVPVSSAIVESSDCKVTRVP